jgi:hypothetical protein
MPFDFKTPITAIYWSNLDINFTNQLTQKKGFSVKIRKKQG